MSQDKKCLNYYFFNQIPVFVCPIVSQKYRLVEFSMLPKKHDFFGKRGVFSMHDKLESQYVALCVTSTKTRDWCIYLYILIKQNYVNDNQKRVFFRLPKLLLLGVL